MPFLTKLKASLVEGEEKFELDKSLIYKIPDNFPLHAQRGVEVIAPEGFITDLASIPRVFLSIFRKLGKHRKAAVIHDRLYDTGFYSKKYADMIFLYAMKESGVNIVKRRLMYWAVKYGGTLSWRKHRKRDKHEEN